MSELTGSNHRCRALFKCAQTLISQRSAGNGPNGLSYDYYYYYKQSNNPIDRPSTCLPFLSAHFHSKRSSNPVDRPSTCLPLLSLNTIAVKCRGRWKCSCSIWNSYGLTDPFCTSPLVWCRLPMFWPVMSMWYFGGFPLLARDWLMSPQFRKVNLPPLWPNTDKFSCYLHTLSKVFEHLASVRFGRFIDYTCALSTSQFPYMKGLGTCDALVCISHTLLSVLEKRQEATIIQNDFGAAFSRVSHQGILFKLCSLDVLGSVLSDLGEFLSNLWHNDVVGVFLRKLWSTLCQVCL